MAVIMYRVDTLDGIGSVTLTRCQGHDAVANYLLNVHGTEGLDSVVVVNENNGNQLDGFDWLARMGYTIAGAE